MEKTPTINCEAIQSQEEIKPLAESIAEKSKPLLEDVSLPPNLHPLEEFHLSTKDVLETFTEEEQKMTIEQYKQLRSEIIEQFNDRLTSQETLESYIQKGDPRINKTTESFEGTDIPVYNISGLPIAYLIHNPAFTLSGNINFEEQSYLDHPEIWTTPEGEHEHSYIGERLSTQSNTVCSTYINTEYVSTNIGRKYFMKIEQTEHTPPVFLYTQIPEDDPNNLLGSYWGDAFSSRIVDSDDPVYKYKKPLLYPDTIEHSSPGLAEITTKRYDAEGKPYMPQALMVFDGNINERALKMAKEFDSYIVNVSTEDYIRQFEDQAKSLVENVDENNLEEVEQALRELVLFDVTNVANLGAGTFLEPVLGEGYKHDRIDSQSSLSIEIRDRCHEFLDKLVDVRLQKIKNDLEDEIKILEEMQQNENYADLKEYSSYGYRPYQKLTPEKTLETQRVWEHTTSANSIYIGEDLIVLDGDKLSEKNSTSKYYDELLPLVEKQNKLYEELLEKKRLERRRVGGEVEEIK